jgi:drug/metabolite transporter (DMT)-like permease
VQLLLQFGGVAVDIDFHELSDANAAHLGHSQVAHGIAHGSSLRIQNSLLRFDDDVDLHGLNIVVGRLATSTIPSQCAPLAQRTSTRHECVPPRPSRDVNSPETSLLDRWRPPGGWRVCLAWLTLCIVWSSTWLAIKIGLRDLPPVSYAAIRFVIAAAALVLVSVGRVSLLPTRRSDYTVLAFTGLLMFTVNYGLLFWGELYVSSGLAAVLQATIPISGMIFAHWMLPNEPLQMRKLLGAVLALAGVAVICARLLDFNGMTAFLSGLGIVLGAAGAAYSNVLLKKRAIRIAPAMLAAWQMFFGVIPMLLIGLKFEGNPFHFHWTTQSVLCLLYLAIIGSSLTFLLLYWLMPRMSVTNLQTISLVTPPGAVVLGWLFGGETLSLWALLGAAFVLVGVWMIFFGKRAAQPDAALPSSVGEAASFPISKGS